MPADHPRATGRDGADHAQSCPAGGAKGPAGGNEGCATSCPAVGIEEGPAVPTSPAGAARSPRRGPARPAGPIEGGKRVDSAVPTSSAGAA